MLNPKNFDFGGFATKALVKCADGRTIMPDAFKHQDGRRVPLVWQHMHKDPANVLGHAVLENREDGVYCYCSLNDTAAGQNAKKLIEHGDVTSLSIFASQLKQRAKDVIHGVINEVSIVLSGANPEATIDNLWFAHTDGIPDEIDETEAVIKMGVPIQHSSKFEETNDDEQEEQFMHAKYSDDATVQDVFDTLDETQKNVVYAIIASALEGSPEMTHSSEEGEKIMKKNIFDQFTDPVNDATTLTHDQISAVMADAKKLGSFKDAILMHAEEYGIEDVDILFPDAKNVRPTPDMIKRDDDWVASFLASVYKTPFSRIKSTAANITADEARAKGYITGKKKKEEVFPVLKRVTTPTTIYKKQKMDRDDIVDIVDFDVVAWQKVEMRGMLNEELARAALIGDGRSVDDEDKVNPLNIRPVWTDDDLYCHKLLLANNTATLDLIDAIVKARKFYKGSGNPNFYSTEETITDMLLVRDSTGRRIYPTMNDVASALRVKEVIAVEVMEDQSHAIEGSTDRAELVGILLNPKDYTMGADKGGNVTMFDDFDIDYNQMKYLIETRCSGALTKPKSAVAIEKRYTPAAG